MNIPIEYLLFVSIITLVDSSVISALTDDIIPSIILKPLFSVILLEVLSIYKCNIKIALNLLNEPKNNKLAVLCIPFISIFVLSPVCILYM